MSGRKGDSLANIWSLVLIFLVHLCLANGNGHELTNNDSWYSQNRYDKCSFIHKLPHILCEYGNSSELEMGFCMTVTDASIVVSQCPYTPVNNLSHLYHNVYQVLPADLDQVNSSLCAPFNRRGFLCSECEEGYDLAAYRYYGLLCVQCSHTTPKLIFYIL